MIRFKMIRISIINLLIKFQNGQTALAIAQRLGYISVIEELKLVTQTTLVSTTIKTTEEKYKVIFENNK